MEQHGAPLDMAQEARAEAMALMRAFDQARNVGEDEARSADADNAELRVERSERIVGDLRFRGRNSGKQGRFAGIGKAKQAGIGNEFQPEPQPAFLAGLARIGATGRAIGRRLEMSVAKTAIAAARQPDTVADPAQIADQGFIVLFEDLDAGG